MKANWLQKTVVAQEMITSVVNALAMGNMDEATAMTQLQSAPAPEVCDVIMAAYQYYPQGKIALKITNESTIDNFKVREVLE